VLVFVTSEESEATFVPDFMNEKPSFNRMVRTNSGAFYSSMKIDNGQDAARQFPAFFLAKKLQHGRDFVGKLTLISKG
jgi:hypothetical protein